MISGKAKPKTERLGLMWIVIFIPVIRNRTTTTAVKHQPTMKNILLDVFAYRESHLMTFSSCDVMQLGKSALIQCKNPRINQPTNSEKVLRSCLSDSWPTIQYNRIRNEGDMSLFSCNFMTASMMYQKGIREIRL